MSSAGGIGAAIRQAIHLRGYQSDVKSQIYHAWTMDPSATVLAVLPTGGGKTVLFASVLAEHQGASCAIAHRQELVGQISMALARCGVRHRIIAPTDVVAAICREHISELGAVYYDPNAPCAVAGVDTLVKAGERLAHWLKSVTLWVTDEGHHLLTANKWGRAAQMFPNARGLGVTATPVRADGKGLGASSHGLYTVLIVGPTMRELIDAGFLTDYRIVVARSHLAEMAAKLGASGDWSAAQLKDAAHTEAGKAIVGDVVATYRKWAAGKLGVVFAPDVDTAGDMARAFQLDGVPAEVVSAKTPADARRVILARFKRRELQVLVNVDLFGEGFDLPAIEVVVMARPTESFSLFAQQFGRALRLMLAPQLYPVWDQYSPAQRLELIRASSKPQAMLIDHVGNVLRHGLPDARNDWTLEPRSGRDSGESDADPITSCVNPECAQVYPRFKPRCPYCQLKPEPASRATMAAVAGDMDEIDPAVLAEMRAAVAEVLQPIDEFRQSQHDQGLPGLWVMGNVKKHDARRNVALNLNNAIEWLAGEWLAEGLTRSEVLRRFYLLFGVDVVNALALPKDRALALAEKIDRRLTPRSLGLRMRYGTQLDEVAA